MTFRGGGAAQRNQFVYTCFSSLAGGGKATHAFRPLEEWTRLPLDPPLHTAPGASPCVPPPPPHARYGPGTRARSEPTWSGAVWPAAAAAAAPGPPPGSALQPHRAMSQDAGRYRCLGLEEYDSDGRETKPPTERVYGNEMSTWKGSAYSHADLRGLRNRPATRGGISSEVEEMDQQRQCFIMD